MIRESSGKIKRVTGNSLERDCMTKKLILETLSDSPRTVKEIYSISGYKGQYNTLTGLLCKYRKWGYLERFGKKPYFYQLTDLGREHLLNPRLAKDILRERYLVNARAITEKTLKNMSEEDRNELFKTLGIEPVEQHLTIAKNNPAKPDKVTVKILPEPVEKTNTHTEYVSRPQDFERIRDLEEMLASMKEENEEMARKLAGRSVSKAETPIENLPKVRKYDELLILCKNKIVDNTFFEEVPYNLYLVTAVPIDSMKSAIAGIKNFRKNHLILLADIQAKPLIDNKFIRTLTEKEFKKLKPIVRFGEDGVYIVVNSLHFTDRMCDLPQLLPKKKVTIHHS
jgi:hypothetical protein